MAEVAKKAEAAMRDRCGTQPFGARMSGILHPEVRGRDSRSYWGHLLGTKT
jgi:hypothetical protein